ncbi:MAG: outer membrane beta-barrel protein [Endomicrobia bacterium]|nr:outer membrane beta-barrel protein [Endomicrobiia bacterium]MCL2799499.1 outer membrane beta-barrel protein [Endomicrobiia bacterium]
MKKIVVCFLTVALMSGFGAAQAFAFDGKSDIYVTPKIIYGATFMKDAKYVETSGGKDDLGNNRSSAFGGSLAVGYDLSEKVKAPVRAELEYSYSEAKAEASYKVEAVIPYFNDYKWSKRIQTLFLNAYYDINTGTKVTPYAGAGLGAGFIKTEAEALWDGGAVGNEKIDLVTVTDFAWNIGLGLGYRINNNIILDIGYRFVDLGKADTDWGYSSTTYDWRIVADRLYQHQFSIGARISF